MAYSVNEIEQRLDKVRELSTGASLYEQVAEEATELARAAQKIARYLRGEQPVAEDFDIFPWMESWVPATRTFTLRWKKSYDKSLIDGLKDSKKERKKKMFTSNGIRKRRKI